MVKKKKVISPIKGKKGRSKVSLTTRIEKKKVLRKQVQQKNVSTVRKERFKKAVAVFPMHVLTRLRSEDGQTINAHLDIIISKGSAFLGKIGQPLSTDFVSALNAQIARGVETYLFLTMREGWNGPYVSYQCQLKSVASKLSESNYNLVPEYYSADYKNVTTWFEILSLERMSKAEMNQIFVLSSGRAIMSVINSSATVFRVGLKPPSV